MQEEEDRRGRGRRKRSQMVETKNESSMAITC